MLKVGSLPEGLKVTVEKVGRVFVDSINLTHFLTGHYTRGADGRGIVTVVRNRDEESIVFTVVFVEGTRKNGLVRKNKGVTRVRSCEDSRRLREKRRTGRVIGVGSVLAIPLIGLNENGEGIKGII